MVAVQVWAALIDCTVIIYVMVPDLGLDPAEGARSEIRLNLNVN